MNIIMTMLMILTNTITMMMLIKRKLSMIMTLTMNIPMTMNMMMWFPTSGRDMSFVDFSLLLTVRSLAAPVTPL